MYNMHQWGDIMRKFIVSDIHGLDNFYYSIMNYLDNINKEEDVTLYINGDVIDRGINSAEILLDLKNRIELNTFKIVYLGGNHELMMFEEFKRREMGINFKYNDWYLNGGKITNDGLEKRLDKDKILEVVDFISNLSIYHEFEEKINNKNILLVHAASPLIAKNPCNLKIKDNEFKIYYNVWAREEESYLPFRCRIGNKNNFTIVGHTPNNSKRGYVYHEKGNFLNIDGGCAAYAIGYTSYEHFPLVEIKDNYLKILTFNNNYEIIQGNYFDGEESTLLNEDELNIERKYLNNNLKAKIK